MAKLIHKNMPEPFTGAGNQYDTAFGIEKHKKLIGRGPENDKHLGGVDTP